MKGWVYVITNPAMPGIVKVGFSLKDPEIRARELNHTGCPHEYEVSYAVLVDEPRNLEKSVHSYLCEKIAGKEWFSCNRQEAIAAIKINYCGEIYTEINFTPDMRASQEEIERKKQELREENKRKADKEKQEKAIAERNRQNRTPMVVMAPINMKKDKNSGGCLLYAGIGIIVLSLLGKCNP